MYKAFSPKLSLKESIPIAVKFGYGGIGLNVGGEFQNDPLALKAMLDEHGLKSAGFGFPVNFRESQETFDADMKKLPSHCEFATKMGDFRCSTWLLPGSDVPFAENFAMHAKRLREAALVMAQYGVKFGLEFVGPPSARKNSKYPFVYDLESLMNLWDAIGCDNVGILLDAWHWDMAGQTFADFTKINGKVVVVHINDAPAGVPVEEQKDNVRALPGATGVLRIKEFFQGLLDMQYDGPVYSEPFYAPLNEMPYEEAMRVETDAINKVWPK